MKLKLDSAIAYFLMRSPEATVDSPEPAAPPPAFGWTTYAERINGRFAMLGFILLLVIELLTRQDIFTWLGLR